MLKMGLCRTTRHSKECFLIDSPTSQLLEVSAAQNNIYIGYQWVNYFLPLRSTIY